MSTITVQLPALQSPALLAPGAAGNNIQAPNTYRYPGPWNKSQRILFIFPADPRVIPGSILTPDAQAVMAPNGQLWANQPILYFPPVVITSNTVATQCFLDWQNNVTKVVGVGNDPVYAVGGRVKDSAGTEYGYLDQILVCWL